MEENQVRNKYYYPNETPKVVLALIVANTILFVVEVNLLKINIWEYFGISWQLVWAKEWYKLLTAMFTHASLGHLGSNMIALYGAGMYLEEKFGSKRFLICYLLSGILGEFIGCAAGHFVFHRSYLSVGASGAVFGLFGMLIVLSVRKQMFRIPFIRILLFIALSIGDALTEQGVDLLGHAGGFIVGIVIGLIYSFTVGKRTAED